MRTGGQVYANQGKPQRTIHAPSGGIMLETRMDSACWAMPFLKFIRLRLTLALNTEQLE